MQKTLLNIEGVGRQLYPDLDLWSTAAPFLDRWLKKQVGVKAFLRRVRENLPYWSEKMPEIPGLIYEVLDETRRAKEELRFEKNTLALQNAAQKKNIARRYFFSGLGSALFIGSLLLFFRPLVNPTYALVFGGVGMVLLIAAIR